MRGGKRVLLFALFAAAAACSDSNAERDADVAEDPVVGDVDGEVTTEVKLARKYRVQFTPTLQYFPKELSKDNKKPGQDVEVWRLLGYWKPFHFLNS